MPKHPLRAWRDAQPEKMTQAQLAVLVGLGVTVPALSDIERGRREPSFRLACRLEEITGIPPRAFLRSVEESKP